MGGLRAGLPVLRDAIGEGVDQGIELASAFIGHFREVNRPNFNMQDNVMAFAGGMMIGARENYHIGADFLVS